MKTNNIIALCLGLIASALLWEYYLKPKYDISHGNEAALQALREADLKALNEAAAEAEGEIVARSDWPYPGEETPGPKEDFLSTRSLDAEDFGFMSAANKPRTLAQMAADGDKRRATSIVLEERGLTAGPINNTVPAGYSAEEIIETEEGAIVSPDPKSRFTMLIAPVKYNVIDDAAVYAKFRKENPKKYPDVDFKKNMIIFLESDGQLANGFFQIDKVDEAPDSIAIDYKVNIIGSGDRFDEMPYRVLKKSKKKIILRQVK